VTSADEPGSRDADDASVNYWLTLPTATAIEQHVRNTPGSAGTFRGQSGTWHLDSNTGVGVFVDEAGNFATGFKLSAEQLLHFPRIGGG